MLSDCARLFIRCGRFVFVAAFLMIAVFSWAADANESKRALTSEKYPLVAHVQKVEMRQSEAYSAKGSGGTYNWHLMITEIEGKTYGLSVRTRMFKFGNRWLHVGDYACRQVKDGFEFEYQDEGKIKHETMHIQSEE